MAVFLKEPRQSALAGRLLPENQRTGEVQASDIRLMLLSSADTVVIAGVAVDTNGQRIAGALIRLYGTSAATGKPLAEDRTSERGVFSLYRTNIHGDIGALYVVYEGDGDQAAKPLKVSATAVPPGVIQSRTADLVILKVPVLGQLSSAEAAAHIAAITATRAVLVEVNALDKAQADLQVEQRTALVMQRVSWTPANADRIKTMTVDKMAPFEFKDMNATAVKAIEKRPGRPLVTSAHLRLHRRADASNLPQVREVVTRIQPAQVAHAFFAALGMHADALQVLWRGAFDQSEVAAAQHRERRQRFLRIAVFILQARGPQVLVEARDGRTVVREDQAQAPSPHQIRIGQVLQHLRDRPFGGGLVLAQLRRRQAVDGAPQRGFGGAQHRERLASA